MVAVEVKPTSFLLSFFAYAQNDKTNGVCV